MRVSRLFGKRESALKKKLYIPNCRGLLYNLRHIGVGSEAGESVCFIEARMESTNETKQQCGAGWGGGRKWGNDGWRNQELVLWAMRIARRSAETEEITGSWSGISYLLYFVCQRTKRRNTEKVFYPCACPSDNVGVSNMSNATAIDANIDMLACIPLYCSRSYESLCQPDYSSVA